MDASLGVIRSSRHLSSCGCTKKIKIRTSCHLLERRYAPLTTCRDDLKILKAAKKSEKSSMNIAQRLTNGLHNLPKIRGTSIPKERCAIMTVLTRHRFF